MKTLKGKVNKGKSSKAPARIKALWLKENEKGIDRLLVPIPDKPPSRVKASVVDMPLPHMKEELIDGGTAKRIKGAEKRALRRQKKAKAKANKDLLAIKKASVKKDASDKNVKPIRPAPKKADIKVKPVVPVPSKEEKVTPCNNKLTKAQRKSAKLERRLKRKLEAKESKVVKDPLKELEKIVEADDIAAKEKRALVGPVQQEPVAKQEPKPVDTSAWMPEVKDSVNHVKPKLTVVPTTPKEKGKIHHFGSAANNPPVKKTRGYSGLSRTEDVVEASSDEHVIDTKLYGTCIRDTGIGMTPSGLPISDFLEGGKYPPPKKLQSVTSSNNDYTHEELAELYDILVAELHAEKADKASRIERFNEMFTAMDKTILELRSELKVQGFNQAHAPAEAEAIIELQQENEQLTEYIDQLEHHASIDGDSNLTSAISKPTMKSLGLQYGVFASEFRSDPVRTFLKHTTWSLKYLKPLKLHFDQECEARIKISQEKKVYAGWTKRPFKLMRYLTKGDTQLECDAIKRIGNKSRLQCVTTVESTDCKKLSKLEGRVWYSHRPVEEASYQEVWKDIPTQTRLSYDEELWSNTASRRENARLERLSKTRTFKVLKPLYKGLKAVKEVANYELIPSKRKALAEHNIAEGKKAIEASSIKRQREAAFEKEINADVVTEGKKDKAVAQAKYQLKDRGFILPE